MDGIKQKKPKNKKGKSKISFDEEIVTKADAQKLILEEREVTEFNKQHNENNETNNKREKKRKKKPDLVVSEPNSEISNDTETKSKKKKRKLEESEEDRTSEVNPEAEEPSPNGPQEVPPKKESIRAKKRAKHAKLLEEKKLKSEVELQQKALNYLSKWKHSKLEWKFEKLRQVWLQQNLFDRSKIPDEFWETTVQYFSGAKGHSRQVILDTAIKIIEDEEKCSNENLDEDYQNRLKRARDIVQCLE